MLKDNADKKLFSLVAVLCLIVFVAFYMKFFKANNEKADELDSENSSIQYHISQLREYYDAQVNNEKAIKELREQIVQIVDEYESDVREEDAIYQGILVAEKAQTVYDGISIGEKDEMYKVDQSTVKNGGIDSLQQSLGFCKRTAVYLNTVDYKALKDEIQAVFESEYEVSIASVTYVRDSETGLLEGAMELNFYSLSGIDKEYVAPAISYPMGVENIFYSTYGMMDIYNVEEE